MHIVKAVCNSVVDRISDWTVAIRYSDSLRQKGTTYIKATITNPTNTLTISKIMGRSVYYEGPFDDRVIEYNVSFFLPCGFTTIGKYHYKIFYYESDGKTRIDNFPSSNTIDVFHNPSLYK